MKALIISSILLISLFSIKLYSQPKLMIATSHIKEKLTPMLKDAFNDLVNCRSPSCKARIYHLIASIKHNLEENNDTIIFYLESAFKESPATFCKISLRAEQMFDEAKEKGMSNERYFAKHFSTTWWTNNCIRCKNIVSDSVVILTEKSRSPSIDSNKNISFQRALISISVDDQEYRKEGNKMNEYLWKLQDELDTQNRIKLDSLYNLYGFPSNKQLSSETQRIAWLVLQHSKDCEWNKIWIQRFLDAYKNKEIVEGFLSQTIKRFFDPNTGYCKNSTDFIKLLISKYPSEYGKIFGYNN